MDFYPTEFSAEALDRIEKERIRAYRELLPSSVYEYNQQDLAIRCIMRIFAAFAKEACALRKERGWTIDRVERESKEFLRRLTVIVVFDKFPGLDRHWISDSYGSVSSDVERRFRASPEWKQYEELLLAVPLGTAAQLSLAQTSGKTVQGAEGKPVERGRFCDQVIAEIKRIKNLAVGSGRSVAEIETEQPNLAVWRVRTSLPPEDQETFNHPNQWGPVVGYAKMVLSKTHDVSPHTISSWVKAYRRDCKTSKP